MEDGQSLNVTQELTELVTGPAVLGGAMALAGVTEQIRAAIMADPFREVYYKLVAKYPKELVDLFIGQGSDVAWALGFPMVAGTAAAVLRMIVGDRRRTKDWPAVAAVVGGAAAFVVGFLPELDEIFSPRSWQTCRDTGSLCGDWKDLAVFAVPLVAGAIYVGRRMMGRERNENKV